MTAMKLYASPDSMKAKKILVVAERQGFTVEVVKDKQPASQPGSTTAKLPVLETAQGCIFSSVAIARYIARMRRDTGLCGSNFQESGLVDSWLEFITHELEVPMCCWTYPAKDLLPADDKVTNKAKEEFSRGLTVINSHLLNNTFMVGHNVTLADISLAVSLADGMKTQLDAKFMKGFPNVMRWYKTISAQPEFQKIVGAVVPKKN